MFPVIEEDFISGVEGEYAFLNESFKGFDEFLLCHLSRLLILLFNQVINMISHYLSFEWLVRKETLKLRIG